LENEGGKKIDFLLSKRRTVLERISETLYLYTKK